MGNKDKTSRIVEGGIAFLLLLCLIDANYGFYQAIRTIVSFGFAYLAYQYYSKGFSREAIIFLCLLILFQPLFKISLGRTIWIIVDIVIATCLLIHLFRLFLSKKDSQKTNHKKAE